MYVYQITFMYNPNSRCAHPSTDAVQTVLEAWRMNGQLCGCEWPIIQESSGFTAIANSPECDSLEPVFNSGPVESAIARAEKEGLSIAWMGLGQDAESSPGCSCPSPGAYVLFTTYVSLESPIRCFDCFRPVALYRMKVMESGEFYELVSWQSDYQACDKLQMNCRVLENAATRELSNVDSDLTKDGRARCKTLATSSGRPFYYYLYRGNEKSLLSPAERRCPGCGGAWHLNSRLHSLFDFKCDRCYLLSNIEFDTPRGV